MASILWEDGTEILWEDGIAILWEEVSEGGGEGEGPSDPGHTDHPTFIDEDGTTFTTEDGIPLVDENIIPALERVGPIDAYRSSQVYTAYRWRVW